jgi:hypothetical protein
LRNGRPTLLCLLVAAVAALGLVGSSGATPSRIPKGYALLTVLRAVHDGFWGSNSTVGDGGGLVRSNEFGLDSAGRKTQISCRLGSVDKTGKTPFQSDPLGHCAVYFAENRVITLQELPDARSRALGWETLGPKIIEPECAERYRDACLVRATKLELVVRSYGSVRAGFRLRWFDLSVANTDPAFGEVEDHDRQQVSPDPLLCGHVCSAYYEYGTKVVLDAQWDPTRTLTVSWDGCDAGEPAVPPTNQQLCPVTMTRTRKVTIYWH